jgi:ABC-type Zn uptake system ZnuABC Zn-binding protein ZnuA
MRKSDYRDNLKLYRKQLLALNTLRSQILSSISYTYLIYIFKYNTTYDVLVSLK